MCSMLFWNVNLSYLSDQPLEVDPKETGFLWKSLEPPLDHAHYNCPVEWQQQGSVVELQNKPKTLWIWDVQWCVLKYKENIFCRLIRQITIWETVTELYIHLSISRTVMPNQSRHMRILQDLTKCLCLLPQQLMDILKSSQASLHQSGLWTVLWESWAGYLTFPSLYVRL